MRPAHPFDVTADILLSRAGEDIEVLVCVMNEDHGYVIELAGDAASLVVKEGNSFCFYSAGRDFPGLDRKLYRSPAEAEEACRLIAFPGRAPKPQQRASSHRENTRRGLARYIR